MSKVSVVLAEHGGVPWPPSVEDFFSPSIAGGAWVTKFTLLIWLAVAALIVFFLVAYRSPKLVPSRGQWLAESVYGFVRDGVAKEIIGPRGVPFAPYLATLFLFVLVTNIFGIIPGIQISPNTHIAFPAALAVLSYLLFIGVGVRRHGLWRYLRLTLFPPGIPWWLYPLLTPIELVSTLIARPVTLAVRLFANMFAGHLMLLIFTFGGFVLMNAGTVWIRPLSIASWAFAVVMTLFELVVALLQAYVFAVLTAVYVQGAIEEEH